MLSRLAAQVIDSTDLNQNDLPTVILMDSDFEESSTSVNDASTLLNSSRDVFNSIAARCVIGCVATTRNTAT